MQIIKILLIALVGTPAVLFLVFWLVGFQHLWKLIAGPADMGPVDFQTLSKTHKPNQFLVCPDGFCQNETADQESAVYNLPAPEFFEHLLDSLEAERNLDRVDDQSDPLQLRFVQRTQKMQYPDTIRVQVVPVGEDRSSLAIYSQSQIGRKDFGVNKARIQRWLKRLEPIEVN